MRKAQHVLLLLCILALLQCLCYASQCAVGDAACYCKLVKGTRVATPSTIRPTCRKTVNMQGTQRIVDIYFPTDIGASGVQFTPWVHLHGVTWTTWWLQSHPEWKELSKTWSTPMGGNADASRMNMLTGSPITSDASKSDDAGLVKQSGYILLVPQGSGDVKEGQMWNSLFWQCMSGRRCVDSVDDVSFLSYVITNVQQLLPGVSVKPQVSLSGYSNGGMMIQALLCKQPSIASSLSGVALIATMLGSNFASGTCQQRLPRSLPLMWFHGLQDSVLPYAEGYSMGVRVTGAEAGTKHWAQRMGCPGASASPKAVFKDSSAGVTCTDLCGGQQTTAVLCSATGVDHYIWDQPRTGYTAGLILWAFKGFQGTPQAV